MGVYSTIMLKRAEVLTRIMSKLLVASNEELGEALFELTRDHEYYNYTVVNDNEEICNRCEAIIVENKDDNCRTCIELIEYYGD